MSERMKGLVPLAAAVAILAFLYSEFALNFTFHWVTAGDLGNGLSLPQNLHVAVPAAFVAWALFFVLGGNRTAAERVAIGCAFGCAGGLALFAFVAAVQ